MIKYILYIMTAMVFVNGCVSAEREPNIVRAEHSPQHESSEQKTYVTPAPVKVNTPAPVKVNTPAAQKPIIPTHLNVPAIKLYAIVEPVGIMNNGKMGVPKAFDKVGLLYPGTKPGEKGNAVMDGHFDHYTGPAVFYRLRKLKKGDLVYVSDRSGNTLTFVVASVESFKTKEAPLEKIFGKADKCQLNLITCDGKFNRKTQEHARRLVVFTELRQ